MREEGEQLQRIAQQAQQTQKHAADAAQRRLEQADADKRTTEVAAWQAPLEKDRKTADEVAEKGANLRQPLQAVSGAAKHKEAFMASVLRDRTARAVAAAQRDRAVAATKLEGGPPKRPLRLDGPLKKSRARPGSSCCKQRRGDGLPKKRWQR